jgi:hypothetical protein
VLSGYNVIILYSGEFYRPSASATLPYTTTATLPDVDSNLASIGDANLRQDLASDASGSGAALVSMEGGPSVEVAVLDRVIRVTSIAAMEAYSAPVGYVFSLNAGGRSGVFDVVAGDFSTELAADTLNGICVGLADNPTATTKVAKRRYSGRVSVLWFGATGDGTSNDSSSVSVAVAVAAPGVLYFPAGTYVVENLPYFSSLKYEGDGWSTTELKLPDDATDAMFLYSGSGVFDQGSMLDLTLTGAGKTGPDGIDVSGSTKWEHATFIGCFFNNFKRAISGSQLDRRPYFYGCRFWDNAVGYDVNGTHPQFTSCDFRDNDSGIDGGLFDLEVEGCTFVRNIYGVGSDAAGSFCTQGNFTGCAFFANEKAGAKVSQRNHFSGCRIYSSVTGTLLSDNEAGIIAEGRLSVTGGGIISDSGASEDFTDAAIVITQMGEVTITGCEILTSNVLRATDSGQYNRILMTGNSGIVRGYFCKIAGTISAGSAYCNISNNTLESTGTNLTASEGIVEIKNVVSSAGNIVKGNTIATLDDAFDGYAIKIDASGSIIADNIIRRTSGIDVLTSDVNTVQRDNIIS